MIKGVEVHAYTVPTDAPEGDGRLAWDSTTMVLIQVLAGGTVGAGWTYGSTACATLIHGTLADLITGQDPMDTGRAWLAMVRAVRNDPAKAPSVAEIAGCRARPSVNHLLLLRP